MLVTYLVSGLALGIITALLADRVAGARETDKELKARAARVSG